MASTRIYRTQSADSSNTNFTFSFWMRRSKLGVAQCIFSTQGGNDEFRVEFDSSDRLFWYKYNGSSFQWNLYTNRKFRNTSAWYHIVLQYDSTQATASNRLKMYVNGVQETSFQGSYENYPSQNENSFAFQAAVVNIGCSENIDTYFDGSLTHVAMVQGTTPAYTTFGETDSTSGIWKPKTAPSVTWGTNGFFLKFENSGNLDLDSSTNGHTFTTAGTLTQNVDTPSNVFPTLNSLYPYTSTGAFTNGNTVPSDYASNQGIVGTLGASSGKYYFEVKINSSSGERGMVGWGARDTGQTTYPGGGAYDWARYNNTTSYYNNATETQISGSSAYTTGDICGCAVDLDNNKIYWYKNGVLENTGGTTITASSTAGNYFPIVRNGDGNNIQCNFGNGYFGTTAITSEGTNASNIGKFEYDVPTGYTALSTKGLNE